MTRYRQVDDTIFLEHEWYEGHDIDKSITRFLEARMARMTRYRQVDGTILWSTNGTNDTMSTSRWHDFLGARMTRMIRYRQVDDTIFKARMTRKIVLPLAEIVLFVPFVQERSCLPLAEIVLFVPFVQARSCKIGRAKRDRAGKIMLPCNLPGGDCNKQPGTLIRRTCWRTPRPKIHLIIYRELSRPLENSKKNYFNV